MSFAPGPWRARIRQGARSRQIREVLPQGEDTYALATVNRHHLPNIRRGKSGYLYDADANARLIAAAPEMYAVIEQLLALLDASDETKEAPIWDHAMGEVETELERVWRKAKGESNDS